MEAYFWASDEWCFVYFPSGHRFYPNEETAINTARTTLQHYSNESTKTSTSGSWVLGAACVAAGVALGVAVTRLATVEIPTRAATEQMVNIEEQRLHLQRQQARIEGTRVMLEEKQRQFEREQLRKEDLKRENSSFDRGKSYTRAKQATLCLEGFRKILIRLPQERYAVYAQNCPPSRTKTLR